MQSAFSSLEERFNCVLKKMNNLNYEEQNAIAQGICEHHSKITIHVVSKLSKSRKTKMHTTPPTPPYISLPLSLSGK